MVQKRKKGKLCVLMKTCRYLVLISFVLIVVEDALGCLASSESCYRYF